MAMIIACAGVVFNSIDQLSAYCDATCIHLNKILVLETHVASFCYEPIIFHLIDMNDPIGMVSGLLLKTNTYSDYLFVVEL